MEEWRPVRGYEGFYKVSNYGRVLGVERLVDNGMGGYRRVSGREKRMRVNKDGYSIVSLSKDGKSKKRYVHTVVYEAFIGEIPTGFEINHIDFDRGNNCIWNLELLTHAENIQYTVAAGRNYTANNDTRGENNPNYGNHTLSERYSRDRMLSKEKQGRPGIQNGRCRRVRAEYPDCSVEEYDYAQQCANDIIARGYTKAAPSSVYCGIWKSIKDKKPYKGISFSYIS